MRAPRVSFGRPNMGPLRTPLSFGEQQALTSNPVEQAAKQFKATQALAPKVGKMPNLPKRQKSNPFFGE